MSSVQILALGNYANGVHGPFGPVDIADDVTSVDFSIACNTVANPTIWSNASTTLDVIPEISVDGGVSWTEAGRFFTNGGPHLDKFGNELQFVRGGGSLSAGTARKYRVTAIIAGGPLRSSATIEIN